MAIIKIGKSGQILLPKKDRSLIQLEPGTRLVYEASEHGIWLHYARPDLQQAYLEVTTKCNLDCAMCIRHAWRDGQGRMEPVTFQAALAGLKSFPKLKRVVFGGYGEPLTHPLLVEMINQVGALGVGVTLITNGLLLKRSLTEALIRAGVDTLVVSLDSMHLQAYQQAGLKSGFDQVLENLQELRDLIHDSGFKLPALGIEFVATQSNLPEVYKLPELAREVGASFVIVNNLLPHTKELSDEILYDRGELLKMGGGWGVHRAGWVKWGSAQTPRMAWGAVRKCRFVDELSLTIGWDGEVSPCSALMHSYTYFIYGRRKEVKRYSLGNVRERALEEIWMSEEYVKFRAKVHDFRFPSCVDCGMDCTYAQENIDCFGNDPSCADCLWAQGIFHCP